MPATHTLSLMAIFLPARGPDDAPLIEHLQYQALSRLSEGWTEPRVPRVLHRQCRLRELVQATVRRKYTVHEVAERRQIVAAKIQVVGFGDALQFTQRWLAQNPRRRRRWGWRRHACLGGRTNGRCRRGDDGCRYPGCAGMEEATTRIVW